jgi:hypothetical protein
MKRIIKWLGDRWCLRFHSHARLTIMWRTQRWRAFRRGWPTFKRRLYCRDCGRVFTYCNPTGELIRSSIRGPRL